MASQPQHQHGMHDYRQAAPILALADRADELYARYANLISNSHYGDDQSLHALTVVETSQTRSGNEP